MDVLYFAFANDPDRPLDELKREDAEINRLLEPLAARGRFKIIRDSFVTLDALADKLSLYKRDLVLFHFSGHAGNDLLQLDTVTARATGIAALLGACPRLQLVVLNGCATQGQVGLLQEQNVPLTIATYRPVEDAKAFAFAVQFYRSLSQFDHVEGAFETACSKVLAMSGAPEFYRSLSLQLAAKDAPYWGLNLSPGRETALHWRLPAGDMAVPHGYIPNQLLLDTLLQTLAPYRPDVARIVEDEAGGIDHRILDKREAVLKALPHPISEQVRFLLTPRSAGSDMKFFDQPGADRLKQMVAVFDTITELMVFIMLAQMWDVLNEKEAIQVPEETRRAVYQLLLASPPERGHLDLFKLVRLVRPVLDQQESGYFVEELRTWHESYREGHPFYEACRFFLDVKPRLDTLGTEAVALAVEAETQLSTVMSALGFVARYIIASIKNIDVLKNRLQKDARYRHIVVKLVQRFVGLEEEPQIMVDAMDSASVLLIREGANGERAFLNLTPFVIDENAFDEKATMAKLYYFERYHPATDTYTFRHIYMPGDQPLLVAQQKNFRLLKAQFDAFAQLLFHQPMRAL